MALSQPWVLWELLPHGGGTEYRGSMRAVAEVSTVDEFWALWHHLPLPSSLFSDGAVRKKVIRRREISVPATEGDALFYPLDEDDGTAQRGVYEEVHLEGLALFRADVRPEWEHPANDGGGEWQTTGGQFVF